MISGNHRPASVHISTSAIVNNYQKIKQTLPENTKVNAVIKADAYGHGAVPVAKALSQSGVDGFCVAISDEALELRDAGLTEPIMILGVTPATDAGLLAKNGIGVTVSSLDYLQTAYTQKETSVGQSLPIHIKIDSGMGRIGFKDADAIQEAITFIANHSDYFDLVSIFTHFATADNTNNFETDKMMLQATIFKTLTDQLDFSKLAHQPYLHQSNSALSLWHPDLTLDGVRLGIAMYGMNPSHFAKPLPFDLEPALSLATEIVHVKQLPAGETISYGATYTTEADEWIATLPIGYADGWTRSLSGFKVLINGKFCPIVGRICMDQCMIRLPHAYPVGTPVVLIGQSQEENIRTEDVAEYTHTIPYEVTCGLSNRLPRIYD